MSETVSEVSLYDKYVYRQSPENKDLYDAYLEQVASFWVPVGEIDLSKDKASFDALPQAQQKLILKILSFFAASDAIVNENILTNFVNAFPAREVSFWYSFQFMMEEIHSQVYSQLIETYAAGDSELKNKLFRGVDTDPYIRRKAEFAVRYMNSAASLAELIFAFAIVEGIFFSGSFCIIFWFKRDGHVPGLIHANELISRDESMHCDYACLLYNKFFAGTEKAISEDRMHEMITEALDIEFQFIDSMFSGDAGDPVLLQGMNAEAMKTYVRLVADQLLRAVNKPVMFNAENPFDFMDNLAMPGKSNFFERRVSEYSKVGDMATETLSGIIGDLDLDTDDF